MIALTHSTSMSQKLSTVQSVRMSQMQRQCMELLACNQVELRQKLKNEAMENPFLSVEEPQAESLDNGEWEAGLDAGDHPEWEAEEDPRMLAVLDGLSRESFRSQEVMGAAPADLQRHADRQMELLTGSLPVEEVLIRQMRLESEDPVVMEIAEAILANLDHQGYFQMPLARLARMQGVPMEKVLEVQRMLQRQDPVGVGCFDLREFLLVQLEMRGRAESLAATILREAFDEFARHRHDLLRRRFALSESALREAVMEIRSLRPRPMEREEIRVITPEYEIRKGAHGWEVEALREQRPQVRIRKDYVRLLRDPQTDVETRAYLMEKFQSAETLKKALGWCESTGLRVLREVVNDQEAFLRRGPEALRPVLQKEVAARLELSASTVCRACKGKYVRTPHGVFEMTRFFGAESGGTGGETLASGGVREVIRSLIAEENPAKPMSDEKIRTRLRERDIDLSRRMIAKHRDALRILPSHLRKAV